MASPREESLVDHTRIDMTRTNVISYTARDLESSCFENSSFSEPKNRSSTGCELDSSYSEKSFFFESKNSSSTEGELDSFYTKKSFISELENDSCSV